MTNLKQDQYQYHFDKLLLDHAEMNSPDKVHFHKKDNTKSRYIVLAFLFVLACVIVTVVALHTVFTSKVKQGEKDEHSSSKACTDSCTIGLVESIPENLTYPSSEVVHPTIYSGLIKLLKSAENSIDIASSYWTLRGKDTQTEDPTTSWGETVFNELVLAGKRGWFNSIFMYCILCFLWTILSSLQMYVS